MTLGLRGWYQVAFDHEVIAAVTPTSIGDAPLVLTRRDRVLRAHDATCPHRGAHLGYGGCLRGDAISCPFHGHRIRLGSGHSARFWVREYELMARGGMVFVRMSPCSDNGFDRYLAELVETHFIVNGFQLSIQAPATVVIENAFDQRHFGAVHGVEAEGFVVQTTESGALFVQGSIGVPVVSSESAVAVSPTRYRATVFSPGIAAVELEGPSRYTIVTGATDLDTGGCIVRLSLAYPRSDWPTPPTPEVYQSLLGRSRRGLEQDRLIWENLIPLATPGWTPDDEPARVFHRFCAAHADG